MSPSHTLSPQQPTRGLCAPERAAGDILGSPSLPTLRAAQSRAGGQEGRRAIFGYVAESLLLPGPGLLILILLAPGGPQWS